jgi:yecA family protein
MDSEPNNDLGLLSREDFEELDRILDDRSDGYYGAPALHGFLVASVIGPEPIPKARILRTALSSEDPNETNFADFPEFGWVEAKVDEWLLRIGRVLQEEREMFALLVYQPKLKEGDTTPDPRTWCRGFLEAMEYHEEKWTPFLKSENGLGIVGPILLTADSGRWEDQDIPNPLTELTPEQVCEVLQVSVLGIYSFWNRYHQGGSSNRSSSRPQ